MPSPIPKDSKETEKIVVEETKSKEALETVTSASKIEEDGEETPYLNSLSSESLENLMKFMDEPLVEN